MQTQRHQERVQQRDHDGEDERAEVVDALQHGGDAVTHADTEGAEQECGGRDHDQQGEERHEHHLHGFGDDLLQQFLHPVQADGGNQWWEDLAGVVIDDHGQAEDGDGVTGGAQCEEFRGEQRGRDGGTDPLIGAELTGGGRTDHDRQEVEHRAPHGMQEHVGVRLLIHRCTEVLEAEGVGQHQEGDDQRGTEQGPQDRTEGVGEEFETVVHPGVLASHSAVFLGAGGGRGLTVAEALHAVELEDLLVVVGH